MVGSIPSSVMRALIVAVKAKSELGGLDEAYVRRRIERVFAEDGALTKELAAKEERRLLRSAAARRLIKQVRAELRRAYGAYWLDGWRQREAFIERAIAEPTLEHHDALLALHRSTAERLPYYPRLYRELFAITGEPASILDLGSGFNLFSHPYLGCAPTYYAHELAAADATLLERYLRGRGFDGGALSGDLTREVPALKVDVAFCFKLLEPLEQQRRTSSLALLEGLRARRIVVSFATASLGGRATLPMRIRQWFLRWLEGRAYRVVELPNESFYVIEQLPTSEKAPLSSREKQ